MDKTEMCSLYTTATRAPTYHIKWFLPTGSATVLQWDETNVQEVADVQYCVRGLRDITDVVACGNSLVFVSGNEMRSYNINDLEVVSNQQSDMTLNVSDLIIENVTFLPRSDSAIVVHHTINQGQVSACMVEVDQDDIQLTPTPFHNVPLVKLDSIGKFTTFHSTCGSSSQIVCHSPDGTFITFNTGDTVNVWNRSNDTVTALPSYSELGSVEGVTFEEFKGIHCVTSAKDNSVAVVYDQLPYSVYLYDLKTKNCMRTIQLKATGRQAAISDVAFMPSNGNLLTYHKELSNKLVVWNHRTGQHLSVESMPLSYARLSPSSDRMVLSLRKSADSGELVLRNSDCKFQTRLPMSINWLSGADESDVEFSSDGTALIGVAFKNQICRVWNAGNGEVLKDIDMTLTSHTEVIGMLTNTHVAFHDERIIVVDIGSGDIQAMTLLDHPVYPRTTARGLHISPKGNLLVGATTIGQIRVLHAHNMGAVKRKTTLQRLKSFSPTATSPTSPNKPF